MPSCLFGCICPGRCRKICHHDEPGPNDEKPTKDPTEGSEAAQIAANAGKLLLKMVFEVADVFTPLKSAAGGLKFIVETLEKADANYEDATAVMKRIEAISGTLQGSSPSSQEEERRAALKSKLDKLGVSALHITARRRFWRPFWATEDAHAIEGFISQIHNAVVDYQLSIMQDNYDTAFKHLSIEERNQLGKLPRAKDAGFSSDQERRHCIEGTRVELLRSIGHWAAERVTPSSQKLYWLNGHAGSGKSTIAQSVSKDLYTVNQLGASFFCSRESQSRSDLGMIFPTLAYQLAISNRPSSEAFRKALIQVILEDADVAFQSMRNQLEKLIIGPLAQSKMETMIVIDALDECKDKQPTSTILDLLAKYIDKLSTVKFFVTGRPEPNIRTAFQSRDLKPYTVITLLHEIDPSTVDRDIRLLLNTRLKEIADLRNDLQEGSLPQSWPSKNDVELLTRKSSGLFIFAETAVKYISNQDYDPEERLKSLTSSESSSLEGSSGLDRLYMDILTGALSKDTLRDHSYLETFRSILGFLTIASDPLSCAAISDILVIDRKDVTRYLQSLHSVLLIPQDVNQAIRFHHKSFPDFLTDPTRCTYKESPTDKEPRTDERFYMNPDYHHFLACQRSLQLLKKQLKKNICGLPRYSMNDDIDPTRRDEQINHALRYCCRHWSSHLLYDHDRDSHFKDVYPLLSDFAESQQLYWFEVLGLLKELRNAVDSLNSVREWLSSSKGYGNLLDLIIDGEKFILNVFDLIQVSVAHLYHSALVITPRETPLRQRYALSGFLRNEPTVLKGVGVYWDGNFRTIQASGVVTAVEYSHNGTLLAAGGKAASNHDGGFSQIFRSGTGELFATITSSTEAVSAVTFRADNLLLATGSGDTVKVWDVRTGAQQGTAWKPGSEGDVIDSLAFCPRESETLLCGVNNGKIHVWDPVQADNYQYSQTLVIDLVGRSALCWLQGEDSTRKILTGNVSGEVAMWDFNTSQSQVRATSFQLLSLRQPICAITSTQDGSRIAVGTTSGEFRLLVYSVTANNQLEVLSTSNLSFAPVSLRFSPVDSNLVVFAGERAMHLCKVSEQGRVVSFFGHGDTVRSVAFSPAGEFISSGSDDTTISIWETGVEDLNPDNDDHHSDFISCAHFSVRDGSRIVSGSHDKTVRVWDSANGKLLRILHGHSSGVVDATFLNDQHIASVDKSGRMALWDLNQTNTLISYWTQSLMGNSEPQMVQACAIFPCVRIELACFTTHIFGHETCIYYWSLQQNDSERPKMIARGSVPGEERIIRIHCAGTIGQSESLGPLVLECASGRRYVAEEYPTIHLESPCESTLRFSESLGQITSNRCSQRALVGQEEPCLQSPDQHWVLDDYNRRILWVPPVCRGHGRWHGKKLVLEGSSGRFTLLDFSMVTLSKDPGMF